MGKPNWHKVVRALGLLVTASLMSGCGFWDFMYPPKQSNHVQAVDPAFDFINWVSFICFFGVVIVMVWFAVKYRRQSPDQKALSQENHSTSLEIAWSIPPFILVILFFWLGFRGYMDMVTPPQNAYEIEVSARQFGWMFKHPNGYMNGDVLEVPAGRPVVLTLTSDDVLHSLSIPAFRVKKDAVRGRYHQVWFTANEPTRNAEEDYDPKKGYGELAKAGSHILYCTELCGTGHSIMTRPVIVRKTDWHPPEPNIDNLGKFYFTIKGCAACHLATNADQKKLYPQFDQGIFGKVEEMQSGEKVTIDAAYIEESIRTPLVKIVKGYNPLMPPMPLSDAEIAELVKFLTSDEMKYRGN